MGESVGNSAFCAVLRSLGLGLALVLAAGCETGDQGQVNGSAKADAGHHEDASAGLDGGDAMMGDAGTQMMVRPNPDASVQHDGGELWPPMDADVVAEAGADAEAPPMDASGDAAENDAAGPPDASPGEDASADAGVTTFRQVWTAIISPRCAYCHTDVPQGGYYLIGWGIGKLDMDSAEEAYASLVGAAPTTGVPTSGHSCGPESAGRYRVIPGDPQNSVIVSKISSETPVCGFRMPDDDTAMLSAEHIQLMRDWISDGAVW